MAKVLEAGKYITRWSWRGRQRLEHATIVGSVKNMRFYFNC